MMAKFFFFFKFFYVSIYLFIYFFPESCSPNTHYNLLLCTHCDLG